ncbi:unnamed protein product [Camellia sinensis]
MDERELLHQVHDQGEAITKMVAIGMGIQVGFQGRLVAVAVAEVAGGIMTGRIQITVLKNGVPKMVVKDGAVFQVPKFKIRQAGKLFLAVGVVVEAAEVAAVMVAVVVGAVVAVAAVAVGAMMVVAVVEEVAGGKVMVVVDQVVTMPMLGVLAGEAPRKVLPHNNLVVVAVGLEAVVRVAVEAGDTPEFYFSIPMFRVYIMMGFLILQCCHC